MSSPSSLLHVLSTAICPDCDGSGVLQTRRTTHYVSREMAMDAQDLALEGTVYRIEEEPEPCIWCWQRNSLLQSMQLDGAKKHSSIIATNFRPTP